MKHKKPTRILGMDFDGETLSFCQTHRSNGDVKVELYKRTDMPCRFDAKSLTEQAAELRRVLDIENAQCHECVVSVPSRWALTLRVDIPEGISAEDEAGMIQLAAEQEFPYPLDEMSIVTYNGMRDEGKAGTALVIALPLNRIQPIRDLLSLARLKLHAVTLSCLALHQMLSVPDDCAMLRLGDCDAEMLLSRSGKLNAFRLIQDVIETDEKDVVIDLDNLTRELKITAVTSGYEKLPRLLLCTKSHLAVQLESAFHIRLAESVECIHQDCLQSAQLVARWWLMSKVPHCQFLPPQPDWLERLQERFQSRSMIHWVGAAAAVCCLVLSAFFVQSWQLNRLENHWETIQPVVEEISGIQTDIRAFRDWYGSDSPRLEVMAAIARAFPETGVVWARSVTIKDHSTIPGESIVTCRGSARNAEAWLEVLENLRGVKEISDVKTRQAQGKSPMQFTLEFTWKEGGA